MKKLCTILTAVLVLGLAVAAYASQFTNNLQDLQNEKNQSWAPSGTPIEPSSAGGDVCATATPLTVPGSSSGNTCDNVNDYDAVCPYTGSTSGDEVYVISGVTAQITIDLCNSAYDTKVYVYEGSCPGTLVACNDDFCNDPSGNPFRSQVSCVTLTGGTYYVVVDGYGGDCGDYNIVTSFSTGCPEVCVPENCPSGALLEGEPVCFDGYIDTYDAGCNSTPPSFVNVPLGSAVCGTGGDYIALGLSYRDTDWYQVDLGPIAQNISANLCASFNSQLAIIDGDIGCGSITLTCGSVFGVPNSSVCCGPVSMNGLAWIFVATSDFVGVPCGSPYYVCITQDCTCPPVDATENRSWGNIKGLYR
jgi:hypothetical protein